ncbi:hypothetical protein [Massilia luteola]|uniref:hypothetical protein n=1 Tax=Massilia luteola TaxID=3081751 RepID=UPI002ACC1BEE|nr:hypothetical protein [Massilia sp. Gc5]
MEAPKKNLQKLIFSSEFMDGVSRAIEKAVAEADAAGLPPAYEPAFSKLKEFRGYQKKSREELIELRRQARARELKKDHATLEFHRKVFDLLEEGGQPAGFITRKAREMIQMWESKGLNSKYGPQWKQLLGRCTRFCVNESLFKSAARGLQTGWRSGLAQLSSPVSASSTSC